MNALTPLVYQLGSMANLHDLLTHQRRVAKTNPRIAWKDRGQWWLTSFFDNPNDSLCDRHDTALRTRALLRVGRPLVLAFVVAH